MPTTESSSPTATSTVNENRRPPLTTLATRLISITRSCRSRPLGLTLSTAMESMRVDDGCGRTSELQPSFARPFGDGGDTPVVAVAAAVEDAGLDPGALGPLGEQLSGPLRLLHRAELTELGLGPGDRHEGAAGVVVDQLGEDSAVRAIDREPRPNGIAAHLRAHPAAPAQPLLGLGQDGHQALFPTLRATCSPA